MKAGQLKKTWFTLVSLLVLAPFIWSCGGGGGSGGGSGGGGNPPTPVPLNNVSGVASKGLVSGGTVSVFAIDASGQKGDLLATGVTDSAGNYTVDVDYDGAVLVEVTGGQYNDEATGLAVTLAGTLRAAFPNLNGNATVAVTPLTELSVRKAEGGGTGLTPDKIAGANNLVSQLIGADILSTRPTDCLDGAAFAAAGPDAQNYALLLAALSQMADNAGQDVFDIIDDLQTDMADGEMDTTGPDLLTGLDDFLNNPNNATGLTDAPDLEDSVTTATNAGFLSTYEFSYHYLQYRTYEDPAENRFQGGYGILKDGSLIDISEITGVALKDAADVVIAEMTSGSGIYRSIITNCGATACSAPVVNEVSGFYARYASLSAETYALAIDFADGGTAAAQIAYPGELALPVIESASLQAQWVGSDLNLSWTNPTGSPNWDRVDQLQLIFNDSAGVEVLYVRVDPAIDAITIPYATLNQAIAMGTGSLARVRIQTRAYTAGGMNYARGYSDRIDLPAMPATYSIPFAYLQYRTYENADYNRYHGAIGLARDGQPIAHDIMFNIDITDSASGVTDPYLSGTFRNSNMWYNCANDPCTQGGPSTDTGAWGLFNPLAVDTYSITIDIDGQTLLKDIELTGELPLPIVTGASLWSEWDQGNLKLGWTNPTGEANWNMVDQLRIIIYDESGNEIIYARADPADASMTIPSALLNQAVYLNGGSDAVHWLIQTRAHDANNMNYARGYSDRALIADRRFTIDHINMMYRNFEDRPPYFAILLEMSDMGDPVAEAKVDSGWIKDVYGETLVPADDGFFTYRNYSYDCISGTCAQSGPHQGSGFFQRHDWLRMGPYDFQVEMATGELLNAERSYPGQLEVPFVASAGMSSAIVGGDLVLNWTNPVGDPNWPEVSQLRVVLYDDGGEDVLYIRVPPEVETVTVPAALAAEAAVLQGGSALTQWQVQTRAYFENGMNVARGYSSTVALP